MTAMILPLLGRIDEAVSILEALAERDTLRLDYKGMLGAAYARQGNRAAAVRIGEDLKAVDKEQLRGLPSIWRARIAAHLGEREEAVALLAQAFAEGTWHHPWFPVINGAFWHTDPDFESLRDYPPFQELMRPKG